MKTTLKNALKIGILSATIPMALALSLNAQEEVWAEDSPYNPHKKNPDAKATTQTYFSDKQEDVSSSAKAFIYLGGGVLNTRESNAGPRDLAGVVLGGGIAFSGKHYLGLDIGLFGGTKKEDTRYYSAGYYSHTFEAKSDLIIVPIHLTYNYFFYFDDARHFRLRFGPTIGITVVGNDETSNYHWKKTTSASISGGGEIGFAAQLGEYVYLDLGYRFSAFRSAPSFSYEGEDATKTFISHQVALSLGLRF